MIQKEGFYMIMVSCLDKLTPLVDLKDPDSGAGNNESKESYYFIKCWKVEL